MATDRLILVTLPTFDIQHLWYLWTSLTPSQHIAVLSPLMVSAAAGVGAWATLRQVGVNKEKEILFRIHEERKQRYETLIKMLVQPWTRGVELEEAKQGGASDEEIDKLVGLQKEDVSNGLLVLVIYGSEACVQKYKEYQDALVSHGQVPKDNQEARVKTDQAVKRKLGELLLQVRRDVGLEDTKLKPRDMLIPFFHDILDPKYDRLYD